MFTIWTLWGSKDAEFTQVPKISIYLSDKMHLKKLFKKKEFLNYIRGPQCSEEILYSGFRCMLLLR
jgi:hypothetical protein